MNIFVLSRNVKACARMHCDRHVVKMPLETAQLLSIALHSVDSAQWEQLHRQGLAYKPTHTNHPCALWARECINNYLWLSALGLELCAEYTHRYGRQHKCEAVIRALRTAAPALPRERCITPFPLVMPEACQSSDVVSSYRNYYLTHKASFARWTNRDAPEWWTQG